LAARAFYQQESEGEIQDQVRRTRPSHPARVASRPGLEGSPTGGCGIAWTPRWSSTHGKRSACRATATSTRRP